MKFSEQWLYEWVKLDCQRNELLHRLTMAGLEVEETMPVAGPFSGIVVGQIDSISAHPDAQRLSVCQVSVDPNTSELLQIVCGGRNVRPGLKVAVAVIGARIDDSFKIKKAKLRGVASQGMLCSESELGLADSSNGIMELAEDAPIGMDLRRYLQLDDVAIELAITPNRGDCLSIEGIAREVAALTERPLIAPSIEALAPTCDDVLPIVLDSAEDCPHYVGRVIKNINVKAITPVWMVEKLRRSGIRSIDPVVDVTNYVMLELGQPLHAFDLDKLQGTIHVRRAHAKEELTLLNDKVIRLQKQDLVIADEQNVLALAGIMGGADSGVSDKTQHIFLESAYFTPQFVGARARRYSLHTDSSHRFERGVDIALQRRAVERVSELLLAITGGELGPVIEQTATAHLPVSETIHLRHARIKRILGMAIAEADVVAILQRLGLQLTPVTAGWDVVVPSYRPDLSLEVDLIEEVGRVVGYDKLPVTRPQGVMPKCHVESEQRVSLSRLRQVLLTRGYCEAITYSFTDPKLQQLLEPQYEALALLNPISADLAVMRTTLWTGLINALKHNQNRQQSRVRLFETGLRFIPQDEKILQQAMLSGVCCGSLYPEQWGLSARTVDFFDMKADVQALLALTGAAQEFNFQPLTDDPCLHPGQAALVTRGRAIVGKIGALHPQIIAKLDLKGPIYLFELKLDVLESAKVPKFATLSKYPGVRRDIAVFVDAQLPAAQILQVVRQAAGELLVDAHVFDVYCSQDGQQQKSIALGMIWQHPERTLVDDEVNDLVTRVVAALSEQFGAVLRE